jgi:hypothetical protein
VDLDLESTSKLDRLATEMGKRVFVLYCGSKGRIRSNFLHVEISRFFKGPDATIHELCDVIEKLSPGGRRIWNASRKKEFNVGYDVVPSERASAFTLRSDTLERMARLKADLVVTYYRGDEVI